MIYLYKMRKGFVNPKLIKLKNGKKKRLKLDSWITLQKWCYDTSCCFVIAEFYKAKQHCISKGRLLFPHGINLVPLSHLADKPSIFSNKPNLIHQSVIYSYIVVYTLFILFYCQCSTC